MLQEITYLTATLFTEGIRLAADMKNLPTLPDTTLPVSAFLDDDMVYITITSKKGGTV